MMYLLNLSTIAKFSNKKGTINSNPIIKGIMNTVDNIKLATAIILFIGLVFASQNKH